MVDRSYLLNTKQMASFVSDGYLRFDGVVPDEINQAAMREFEAGVKGAPYGTPLSDAYPADSTVAKLLAMPLVQGIIHSLVGPNPLFDHHAIHVRKANEAAAQNLHGDAVIDTRTNFDIQLMYFPHEIPLEMGGTLLVPGTQYRRINESDIARYQNMRGQIPMVCPAGSLLVLHHGIWHCGRQNTTGRVRYMFKIRLNPTVRQTRLWNSDDIDDPEVEKILSKSFPWAEYAAARLDIMNRTRVWQHLTGNSAYDTEYWWTRVENTPEFTVEEVA